MGKRAASQGAPKAAGRQGEGRASLFQAAREHGSVTGPLSQAWHLQRGTGAWPIPEGCCFTSTESGANAAFFQKAVELPRREVLQLSSTPLPALPPSSWGYRGHSDGWSRGARTKVFMTLRVALNFAE